MFLARQSAFYCIDLYKEMPTALLFSSGMITWKGKGFVARFYDLSILFPSFDSIVPPGTCSRIEMIEETDLLSIKVIERNVKCNVEVYQKENEK